MTGRKKNTSFIISQARKSIYRVRLVQCLKIVNTRLPACTNNMCRAGHDTAVVGHGKFDRIYVLDLLRNGVFES